MKVGAATNVYTVVMLLLVSGAWFTETYGVLAQCAPVQRGNVPTGLGMSLTKAATTNGWGHVSSSAADQCGGRTGRCFHDFQKTKCNEVYRTCNTAQRNSVIE